MAALTGGAMRRVSTRNLLAHKVRLVLTVLAVVLGTAFIAGSLIFTNTVKHSFDGIFDNVAIGVDAQVSPKTSFDGPATGAGISPAQQQLLQQNQRQLGIDKLEVNYVGPVAIEKKGGGAISSGGAPSLGSNFTAPQGAVDQSPRTFLPGWAAPKLGTPYQFVLNKSAVDKSGLHVGDVTTIAFTTGPVPSIQAKLVGIYTGAGEDSGYVEAQFAPDTAKYLFSSNGDASTVSIRAATGVTPEKLVENIKALTINGQPAFPDDFFKVQTGDEVRQENKDNVNSFLNVFNYILIAFGLIGLLVGVFIIFNTFTMIIAQRIRELALLRAIGASQRQIIWSVLLEAAIVGLIGAIVGLVVGVGLAKLLGAITSSSGLPQGSLQIGATPIVVTLLVGVLVTVVSAVVPAWRAAKTAPVEAMRDSAAENQHSLRLRTLIGSVLFVIGAAVVGIASTGDGTGAAGIVGVGALVLIIAVLLAAPALSRPVVGTLGRVLAAPFGKIGVLARTNAVRNPRRTAATAFALTLGLMLVAVIGTLGSSLKATIDDAVDQNLKSDLIVTGLNQGPVNPIIAGKIKNVPGVTEVIEMRDARFKINSPSGDTRSGTAVVGNLSAAFDYSIVSGNPSKNIPAGEVYVSDTGGPGWKVGETHKLYSPSGQEVSVRVGAVFKDDSKALGTILLSNAVYDQLVTRPVDGVVFVKTTGDTNTVQDRVKDATKADLTVVVQNRAEFKKQVSSQINTMLITLYAMLGLSLVVAVLGIINTLALSVIERRREVGMLRAVGTARAQIRRMIYIESTLISIFGALLGVVIGSFIGWALASTLQSLGISNVVLPWGTIVITLIAAAVVGVLAALWPAIKASRTKPLEAIADV